jgi:hypothetical protein
MFLHDNRKYILSIESIDYNAIDDIKEFENHQ